MEDQDVPITLMVEGEGPSDCPQTHREKMEEDTLDRF